MTSVEQQARDLLQPVMTRIWSYSVFNPERDAAEATTALAPLLAELSRLRAQETRIRDLCTERPVERQMRLISRDITGNPIVPHTVMADAILAALDTEELS